MLKHREDLSALSSVIASRAPFAPGRDALPATASCSDGTCSPSPRNGRPTDSEALAKRHGGSIIDGLLRLPPLINTNNHILRSVEARAVIEVLAQLVYAAVEHLSSQQSKGGPSTNIELELELIGKLITSSSQIAINQFDWSQSSEGRGTILNQRRKRKRIALQEGNLMLTCLNRSRLPADVIPESSTCTHFEAAGHEFIGTVTFFPTNPLSSLMIIASVHQEELRGGHTFCAIPRLLVSNLLPSDAPVFRLARKGRVAALRAMISRSVANLHVRDVNGRTLLHHAIGHPAMCRFLIGHGADVNEVAGRNNEAESLPLLAATIRATTSARDSAEFQAAKECIQILLRAGADPTISLKLWDSPFHVACTPNDMDIFDVLLELGKEFVHVELADSRGRTPLLRMCKWYLTYSQPAFSHLIDRGADINARDTNGATCLHLAIENAKRPLENDEFEALTYLVHCGADVHATNFDGKSVSEVAFETHSTDVVYKLGSYRGDLWLAVLAAAGYDASSFVTGWPREKVFTSRYTQVEFEKLWKGAEHLCPYYHDVTSDSSDNDELESEADESTRSGSRRRSIEKSIRQRTDISVTVEPMEGAGLASGEGGEGEMWQADDEYAGTCMRSQVLSVETSDHQGHVPLLWDPSLAHHLMPNPWHDILPEAQDMDEPETARSTDARETDYDRSAVEDMEGNDQSSSPEETAYHHRELGRSWWDGVEIENVWDDQEESTSV